jgi:hypothetical protein
MKILADSAELKHEYGQSRPQHKGMTDAVIIVPHNEYRPGRCPFCVDHKTARDDHSQGNLPE